MLNASLRGLHYYFENLEEGLRMVSSACQFILGRFQNLRLHFGEVKGQSNDNYGFNHLVGYGVKHLEEP